MILSVFLILTFNLIQISTGFKCACSIMGTQCPEECEAGSYCTTTWIVAGADVRDKGCKTTRSDLSGARQCQTNRRGLVTCVCNSEKCNDDSFSIPSDAALVAPKTIKCFNMDLIEDNFCFGHYCTYSEEMVMNDFGDLLPSISNPYRGCSDDEYTDDVNSINICTITNNVVACKCNTPFCNRAPSFPVPLGNVICYMSSAYEGCFPTSLKYCHVCYILPTDYEGKVTRGCLSVSDGAPAELKKIGGYDRFKYCDKDLCNGEYSDDAPVYSSGNRSE